MLLTIRIRFMSRSANSRLERSQHAYSFCVFRSQQSRNDSADKHSLNLRRSGLTLSEIIALQTDIIFIALNLWREKRLILGCLSVFCWLADIFVHRKEASRGKCYITKSLQCPSSLWRKIREVNGRSWNQKRELN